MSDLSATNCGCGCEREERMGRRNNSCIWIILLLFFCCGNGSWGGWGREGGGCECIWIILLLFFCCGDGFWGRERFDDGCGC